MLAALGAHARPSTVEAVEAARRLINYYDIYDIALEEPQYPLLGAMRQVVPDDAFVVWDVTQLGFYARTHWPVNHPKTYLDSGYQFNLGFASPTALGAKVAQPHRLVLCMSGEGGFMFNASELSTAVKYGINVVTVIWRNDSFGKVARDMNEVFSGTYETDLANPDFVKFAESFGAIGMRAESPMDNKELIPKALELERPVVIDVPVSDMSIPAAPHLAPVYSQPWTRPQEGLIAT